MIQGVMYFALGLLTAGLLAVLVTPAIWRRAMRLTRQRIERSVPMTLAEIEADKDQLRAEFAMSTRRLEMSAERLREKTTDQVIEINKRRAEIVRLSNEVGDQAEAIETLEEKLASLDADHATAVQDLRAARELIVRHEADLADRAARIERLESLLAAADQLTAEQKLELAANATDIANLTDRLNDTSAALATMTAERDRLAASLIAEQAALAAERRRTGNLEASLARIEAERARRLAELERRDSGTELAHGRARAEGLAARIADLQAARQQSRSETPAAAIEDATVNARLAELQAEQSRLGAELEARNAEIAALRTELANFSAITEAPPLAPAEQPDGDNVAKAIAAAEAERAELVTRLASAEAANHALAAENAELRQLSGPDWDIERENALLRDRLAQIASDVVRLSEGFSGAETPAPAHASNGHGSDEPTRAVPLPVHHPAPTVEAPPAPEPVRQAETKPLAERLRALQHTAARH